MSPSTPIAIVGLACRLPGDSNSPEKLWQVLSNGKNCYTKVPSTRYNVSSFRHPSHKLGTILPEGGHYLSQDVSLFDASFFNIYPSDAKTMDPAQRLLLEVIYEALESGGIPMESLAGSDASCHVGCFTRDWMDILMRDPEAAPKYAVTGMGLGMQANRASWFFDWHGASVTLDTACSSSLVALHLACQTIRTGESRVAVAAGTNLMLSPDLPAWMSNMNFLSPDGKCKSFDASANGYGRGEGVGVVVLKDLRDAVRDGDNIRAVIRATGVNQDGHTSGITLPNSDAQIDLIRTTYERAGLAYEDTGYFEAHGTGTRAGDEAELRAILETIAKGRTSDKKLHIGSIKTNIGHTEGTAGIAGLIKTVLMLEKGLIPPNIIPTKLNQRALLSQDSIVIPTSLTPWPSLGIKRASISSFGYGGTNAHAVIDDAATFYQMLDTANSDTNSQSGSSGELVEDSMSDGEWSASGGHTPSSGLLLDTSATAQGTSSPGSCSWDDESASRPRLMVFSAHEESVVQSLMQQYGDHLEQLLSADQGGTRSTAVDRHYLDRLAHTLGARRSRLPWSSFVVVDGLTDMAEKLKTNDASRPARSLAKPRAGFVFTGQGAQWAGMGKELLCFPVFRKSILAADEYLRSTLGAEWSAMEELTRDAESSRIGLAKYSQPLCTVLQVALIELLESWGIKPVAVVGHSSGEIAAAVCAGAITHETAWKVAYWRGKLSGDIKVRHPGLKGAMMAVGASPEQVQPYLERVTSGRVQIACINSPDSVTLSGDEPAVDEVQALLKADGLFARKLVVENAYHSYHMERIADDYSENIKDCTAMGGVGLDSTVSMVSSVSGHTLKTAELQPAYWVRNLTSPVRFSDALSTLLKGESTRRRRRRAECAVDLLLEIGPHGALKGPIRQILQKEGFKNVEYASVLQRGASGVTTALQAAGFLFARGVHVDIDAVNQTGGRDSGTLVPIADLPTYPWNHTKSYWAEFRISREHRFRAHNRVDLLGAPVADGVDGDPAWRQFLRTAELPWIRDHKIQSSILFPAAGFICIVIEAARQIADVSKELDFVELRDVSFDRPMIIPDDESGVETKVQLLQNRTDALSKDWYEFRLYSSSGGSRLELNSYGYVALRYKRTAYSWNKGAEDDDNTFRQTLSEVESGCRKAIVKADFYSRANQLGLNYGPCFQNLTDINYAGGSACATLVVHDTKATIPSGYEDSVLLHPTTLDCMFQLLFAAVEDGGSLEAAAVPVFIGTLKVKAECPRDAGHALRGFAEAKPAGEMEYAADIVFGNQEGKGPMVEVSGIRCRIVGGDSAQDASGLMVKERYGLLKTAPCLQLCSSEGLCRYMEKRARDLGEKFSVVREILELAIHASPDAAILELCEGQTSKIVDYISSLSRDERQSSALVRWTVANLEASARDALATQAADLGYSNVAFETSEMTADAKNRPKQDVILVTSGWAANLNVEKHEFIQATLKDTGHLIIVSSASASSTLHLPESFDRIIEVPSPQDHGRLILASRTRHISSFPSPEPVVLLLPEEPSERTLWVASEITWHLSSRGISAVHRRGLHSVDLAYGAHCLSLLELEHPLPLCEKPDTFTAVKKLLLQTKRLLWVAGTADPRLSIMTGLMRTVRNENPTLDLVSVALGKVSPGDVSVTASLISDIFVTEAGDKEFVLEDALCHVSRYSTDGALNWNVASQRNRDTKELVALSSVSSTLVLDSSRSAQMDTWCFQIDREAQGELLPDEIEIEVKAVGMNSPSAVLSTGQHPNPFQGRAASGLVTRVGSAVTRFRVGDRVLQLSSKPFKTRLRSSENLCQLIPERMTFVEATSIPVALSTALACVRDLGKLKTGETILIHAAATNIGQAAIQIAQPLKAKIFATVASLSEKELLCSRYGLLPEHIFSFADASFVQALKRLTNGKGVDMLLNCLDGELLRQTWSCIAAFGRFVHLGGKLGDGASLDTTPFSKGATFACFDLDLMLSEQPDTLGALLEDATTMIKKGAICPMQTVKEISATTLFTDAHALQQHDSGEDVVISIAPEDKIPVHPSALNGCQLEQDATYIIVGGLGGLGRSQALHMAKCGAGCILFLSRSGASDPKAAPLIEELASRGTRAVCWSCDVADETQLRAALKRCAKELPPIRGCIQGAMVLRDGIFETMTHDDFRTSLRPKVQGTWNLHRHLPRDLDFFIMLSSISGITGNPGQANYAAGNTFMDALAHHRRELGLPAVSIDLGLMLDVGFVAERQGVSNLKKWESVGLTEEEYLLIMSAAMRGTFPVTNGDARNGLYEMPAQVVTGLATGGHVAAHGLDDPFYFSDARFKRLVKAELSGTAQGASGGGDSVSIQQLLAASTSAAEAADIIAEAIRQRMARVIDKNPENIELGKPLHVYGVDSLMAVEVRNWLAKEMQCSIGLFDVMGSPGIGDLAVKIAGLSKLVPKFADES